jgi:L-fuconolactonase
MPTLAKHANVMAKLSGMVTEANWATWSPEDLRPFVAPCLDWFGSSRLMFGSDWPVCLLAATYEDVVGALEVNLEGLSGFERAKIFGLNAQHAYRLKTR